MLLGPLVSLRLVNRVLRASPRTGLYAGRMHVGLAEWSVLAVLDEGPAHGFAVSQLTARDGELGRVWFVPRPVVYRALGRLHDAGLIEPTPSESGPGPQRTPYSVTPLGRREVRDWLDRPVPHVRDLRSHFLLKLALHERRGRAPTRLVARQREVLEPIAAALADERRRSTGFDDVLLAWRETTTAAALAFLDELGRGAATAPSTAPPRGPSRWPAGTRPHRA